jgi:hypothetical protein
MSTDWRSHVSTDQRLANIFRIVELAHAVQPFNEVLNRAKQAEASVFQRATSRENYTASMEQLVSYMKKTIEDKTKQHLEQLAEKEYKELSSDQKNDNLTKSSKPELEEQSDQLIKKQLELKNLWKKRIEEIMEQLRHQQQAQSRRLCLLLHNLQLQQSLQKKTSQTQSTNITPLLQQQVLLPQPNVSVLQTNFQQLVNPLFQQQPTFIFQQQNSTLQFCQPQTYSFQHQPMTIQQLFTLTQPSFTLQPLITQQASHISTPLKCEQSQPSLPHSYYLVKDANIHKEAFKEALKLPINEQKRHPPPGEPVIPVHALKVEGSDTTSQVQLRHQFEQNCRTKVDDVAI